MELFDVSSTNVHGQIVLKCIQSTIKGGLLYCAVSVDRPTGCIECVLNAHFVHSVDMPLE